MAAFAQSSTLASYLGMDVDPTRADVLLGIASDAIRAKCQQTIDWHEDDTITLDPEPSLVSAFLPELPVIAVTAVQQLGQDSTWYDLQGDQYDWSTNGVLYRLRGGSRGEWTGGWPRWTNRRQSIRVTYTHGYQTPPSDLAGVAVSVAARLYENPLGTTATAIGTFHEQFGGRIPGIDFTDLEESILDKYTVARIG